MPALSEHLLDLFQPGQGALPYLAGRESELEQLGLLFRPLLRALRGEAPSGVSQDAVLIGPRSNGKTALLGAFEESCRAEAVVGLC